MWRSISSLKRNITRARASGEVSDQPVKASFAMAMARSTSAFEARGTLAESAPVVGLKTSPKRPVSPRVGFAADEMAQFTDFCKRGITGIHGALSRYGWYGAIREL